MSKSIVTSTEKCIYKYYLWGNELHVIFV